MSAVDVQLPPLAPAMDSLMDTEATPAVSKYTTGGLIYPPPDIRTIIDRTASFVARSANPPQFEEKIRENQRQDPKFSFLNSADPYHAYYRLRIEKIEQGEEDEPVKKDKEEEGGANGTEPAGGVPGQGPSTGAARAPKQPPPLEFVMDLPSINAIDLDTIKLTALFTARRGRAFLAALSVREGRNYQFEFLRPTHSLFSYFNRLVEQYTRVLLPPPETLSTISELGGPGGKWTMLSTARERGEYERWKKEREKKREDDKEAEQKAFAEIDWHDYAIVQTIEFTSADAQSELPPPMSIAEMENMTLAQKRMAAMINESTAADVEAAQAAQAQAAAAGAKAQNGDEDDVEMEEESDDEDSAAKRKEAEEKERELEKAREIQARSLEHGAPMKIRKDYVPKGLASKAKVAMTTCTICGQSVPVDELDEHMRIELLDPRWKVQRDAIEQRRAQAKELQRGADVVSSLKQLARTRVDLFDADEDKRKREEEEELAKRKEREKVVWDGHTASKANTLDKFQTNVNFDEQIAAIHKAKGLGQVDTLPIGPSIGPSIPSSLPPPPISLPQNPTTLPTSSEYAGAVISAGPQPASASGPVMYHPLPPTPAAFVPPGVGMGMGGMGMGVGMPAMGPPPGMHPSRLAALGVGGAGLPTRPAEDMADMPAPKRQRIEKLPEGHYYPEQDWINLHPDPISLSIQLPSVPDKPEWNLNGAIATLQELPLTLLISTLRDRLLSHIEGTLPASRVKFSFGSRVLTNANTLASYNFDDGDLVKMEVREAKKK